MILNRCLVRSFFYKFIEFSLIELSFLVYIADVFLNNRINGNSPSHISYGSSENTTSADFGDIDAPEAINGHVRV